MKIRTGFVSNSSSASFVVKYIDTIRTQYVDGKPVREEIKLLSDEEVSKLIGYGFYWSCNGDPYFGDTAYNASCDKCECNGTHGDKCCLRDVFGELYLRYWIVCNEDEVITFLKNNDIPFIAGMSYDCQLMVYNRGNENVLTLQNEGMQYLMSCGIRRNPNDPKYFKPDTGEEYDWECNEMRSYLTAKLLPKKDFEDYNEDS